MAGFNLEKTSEIPEKNSLPGEKFNFDQRVPRSETEKSPAIKNETFDFDKRIEQNEKNDVKPLSETVKNKLKEGGMSEFNIKNCSMQENGVVRLDTGCADKLKEGGLDGVKYASKSFELNGLKIEGIFPKFDAKFECKLPQEKLRETDYIQMKDCTLQLKSAIEQNPEMADNFTPRQLEQIRNGSPKISNLTWHHCEETGKMQLVDEVKHAENPHVGGKSIWGGGR